MGQGDEGDITKGASETGVREEVREMSLLMEHASFLTLLGCPLVPSAESSQQPRQERTTGDWPGELGCCQS